MFKSTFPIAISLVVAVTVASSQTPSQTVYTSGATQSTRSSASPAAQLGVYAFPAKSQGVEQQQLDELQCYNWAKDQTHLDPLAQPPPTMTASTAPPPPPPEGQTMRGAGRGAAGGALFGAIAGNAGRGAAIGAAVGAVAGRSQQRDAEEAHAAQQQQAAEAANQANQQAAAQRAEFQKAFAVCLNGKGYTVR